MAFADVPRHLFIILPVTALLLILQAPLSARAGPGLYPPYDGSRTAAARTSTSQNGMVASAHPLATAAGIAMLKKGGNAVDAAVAVSFVISVVRPHSTGIGGGGFLLLHEGGRKGVKVYDFRERAPTAARETMFLDNKGDSRNFVYKGRVLKNASVNGHLSAGTPGLIAGLLMVHRNHGRLPLKTVMEPAIRAAAGGFAVYPSLAAAIRSRAGVLEQFEDSRRIFMPGGRIPSPGHQLIQADLARTLGRIAAGGADAFYKGEIARRIIAEMQDGGGIISAADLRDYRVRMREPVRGTYRGYEIYSMPPPSSGGVHIIQMLNILEGWPLAKFAHNSPAMIRLVAEAMRLAYADRARYLGDPDFVKVPVKGLVSKKYATALRKKIPARGAGNSRKIFKGNPADYESPSTTHLSVVDQWDNAVSSTQTINLAFGSGVVIRGTGIVLNNEMDDFSKKPGMPNAFGLTGGKANAIKARKTMLSSMSPTILFDGKGRPVMILGSPGGSRIINATLQTIINKVDYGFTPAEAVQAWRFHHQWLPDKLFLEKGGFSAPVMRALTTMGYTVQESQRSVGDVQAIFRTASGWTGASDTRSDGRPQGI